MRGGDLMMVGAFQRVAYRERRDDAKIFAQRRHNAVYEGRRNNGSGAVMDQHLLDTCSC